MDNRKILQQRRAAWHADCTLACKQLPHQMQKLALTLLDNERDVRKLDRSKQRAARENIQWAEETFLTLNAEQRQTLFDIYFPQLMPYAELAWQRAVSRPYQYGAYRRAFRDPTQAETAKTKRRLLLIELLEVGRHQLDLSDLIANTLNANRQSAAVGFLLAAAVDARDAQSDRLFDALVDVVRGDNPTAFGRHILVALLNTERPEGWEVCERLLLAAQRQEGLRQTILNIVDEARPEPFQRILSLVHAEKLARFNSVARAANVWLGMGWDVTKQRDIERTLLTLTEMLQAPPVVALYADERNPERCYLALFALAIRDVQQAFALADHFLASGNEAMRFVSAEFLGQAHHPQAWERLLTLFDDPLLTVAGVAITYCKNVRAQPALTAQVVTATEAVFRRFPAKEAAVTEPLVWAWQKPLPTSGDLLEFVVRNKSRSDLASLIVYADEMNNNSLRTVLTALNRLDTVPSEFRPFVFKTLSHTSSWVRSIAVKAAAKLDLTSAEAQGLETLLTRTAADLRRSVINLLLKQPDEDAYSSSQRLMGAGKVKQREAGLEMLRTLKEDERQPQRAVSLASEYAASRKKRNTTEQTLLDALTPSEDTIVYTLEDGFGLIDPAKLTPRIAPKKHPKLFKKPLFGKSAIQHTQALIYALQEFVGANKERTFTYKNYQGDNENTLAAGGRHFPMPDWSLPLAEDLERLPYAELWLDWWRNLPEKQRQQDGFGAVYALVMHHSMGRRYRERDDKWLQDARDTLFGPPLPEERIKIAPRPIVYKLLHWFWRYENPSVVDRFLAFSEHSLATVADVAGHNRIDLNRRQAGWQSWLTFMLNHHTRFGAQWTDAQHIQLWRLLHWWEQPRPGLRRLYTPLPFLIKPLQLGAANEHDVVDHLLEKEFEVIVNGRTSTYRRTYSTLRAASSRRFTTNYLKPFADANIQTIVERVRKRLVEIELKRGDLPTEATYYVRGLATVGGLDVLFPLLHAMDKMPLERAWATYGSKKASFSHLLRATYPGEQDTPAAFAQMQAQYNIPEKRLLEVAMYTPQWSKHVTELLGWQGLDEAVWWFHAHTRDNQWRVDRDTKADWASEIAERTPLSAKNLTAGAVDVAWFHHAYGLLGDARWQKLHAAAKMASTSGGHKRAQLYAEAMLGQHDEAALITRIEQKRYQDGIRALGLYPITDGSLAEQEQQILSRYMTIQKFAAGSRKFGSQRKASEKLAVEIGMENLARTAGYPDPLRLQWAMEQQAVADLAEGPVRVVVEDTTVTLSVDYLGNPQLAVEKKGKSLKSVPAKLRKLPEIKALQTRKKELTAQGKRMRKSLEQAMMRGDEFTAGELGKLMGHPVLKPLLEDLVFVSDTELVMGYPADGVTQLSGVGGASAAVSAETQLRIAHPHDLFEAGNWDAWQRDCFRAERIQPFKQLFRELYVVTPAELEVVDRSMRFAGQQVNPSQAMALLGQNEWIVRREEGVHRTFHAADLTAWLQFADGDFYGTPADAGGTLTLDTVRFTKRGEWKSLPLAEIPPRIFSTVMRNLDLVVSVAHAGGIDPEATMSTKEARAALVTESAELLKLNNVAVTASHVQIEGTLSKYTIHLGSGVVHMQPGGYVCIVPVGAAQRGRVFLPFVDSDPKSAEIIAKTVMLARDQKIKDPTILQQIVRN